MPQPLLGRRGILSLAALTLHYSCLSVVLHVSRTAPGGRYNASTAIFLTELVKIAISLALVLCSGELHKAVVQRRQAREEELAALLVSADRKAQEDRRRRAVEEEKALWARLQEGGEDPCAFASPEETIVPGQSVPAATSVSVRWPDSDSPRLDAQSNSIAVPPCRVSTHP